MYQPEPGQKAHPDIYRLQKSHLFIGAGGKRTPIHQKRKKRPRKNHIAGRQRLQRGENKVALTWTLSSGAALVPSSSRSHPLSIERDGKSTPIDERRKERHPVVQVQRARRRALENANWRRWNRPWTVACRVGSVKFSRRKLRHAYDNSADSEDVAGAREPSVHMHCIFCF